MTDQPQTWRIKPFTVEAMRWHSEDADNAQAVLDWLELLNVGPQLSDDGQSIILLATGTLVSPGSWVFRMPTGLVATGPDDWFHRSYERVADNKGCPRCGRTSHGFACAHEPRCPHGCCGGPRIATAKEAHDA